MRQLRPALLPTMWCSRVRRTCSKKRCLNVQRSALGAWKLRRKLSSLPRKSRTLELFEGSSTSLTCTNAVMLVHEAETRRCALHDDGKSAGQVLQHHVPDVIRAAQSQSAHG